MLACALITFAGALLIAGPLSAQPAIPGPPNDCSHPYWANTLRCRDIAVNGLAQLPQPNAGTRPATLADLREYTRVFLGDLTLRCMDGTRPLLYVAPAVCTNPGGCLQPDGSLALYGAPTASDDWIISFVGGGACHARDLNVDGVYDDGRFCTDLFPFDKLGMTSAFDQPMQNLEATPAGSGGILSRNPATNPVFAAYNSVRVEKCSYDRYLGRSEYANVEGALSGTVFRYTLFTHGQRIAEAAIHALRNGLSYTTWADTDGDGDVDDVSARLPRLSNARQVVFIGHSGGAHGLRHNIDRLASLVKGARDVDVRALVDANFLPSIEGEAAFNGLGGDEYTDQWTGNSTGSGVAFSYDGEAFHRDALVASQITAWKTSLDDSCLAAHSRATRWKCRDRQHVLFNHISTPMFIREDFTDDNLEHTDGGNGHHIPWALRAGCTYPHVLPGSACDARFAPLTEHRARLTHLAETLLSDIGARSEMASRMDTSLPAGQFPSVFLWMPACNSHVGAYANPPFFLTSIVDSNGIAVSMHGALVSFLGAPAFNQVDWRIHGTVGGKTMKSNCPP